MCFPVAESAEIGAVRTEKRFYVLSTYTVMNGFRLRISISKQHRLITTIIALQGNRSSMLRSRCLFNPISLTSLR